MSGGQSGTDDGQSPGRELFVIGAGWYALEVAEWAEDAGWGVAGLVELLDPARVGTRHGGREIIDGSDVPEGSWAIVAGGGDRGEHWTRWQSRGLRGAEVVHPTAHVSVTATLAPGVVLGPASVIGAGTALGPHALVSRGSLVGHHVNVGAFARLLPGANIAGHVVVGARATVGMSAAIADHLEVGDDATVAAGAIVLRNVPRGARVQGVPAREYGA